MSRVIVIGSINVDLTVAVEHQPAPGETILGADPVVLTGGKGANQAVAAARQHPHVTLVGAVGTDGYGERAVSCLRAAGLSTRDVAQLGTATGLALITVSHDGQNAIVVCPGANARVGELPLPRFERGDVVLLQLEIPVSAAERAARAARAAGATVVLNAAPLPTQNDAVFASLLSHVDVLVVNDVEAHALGDASAVDAASLTRYGPGRVVVTLGGDGAVFADGVETGSVPAHRVAVVDTTGAGDAFCATLGVALASGLDLRAAVERGCAAGALSVTGFGAQTALPTAAQIDALVRETVVA